MAKNAIARHPKVLPRHDSVKQDLWKAAQEDGSSIAYKYRTKDGVREVSYKEFHLETLWLGTGLNSLGMARGHIGCVGENSYNWILTYLTALQSEGVFCPIDKELPEADLVQIINHGDDDIIFCDGKREGIFRNVREQLPNVKYFVCFDRDEDEGEFLSFKKLFWFSKKAAS